MNPIILDSDVFLLIMQFNSIRNDLQAEAEKPK
jgi:hypothetical protein